MNYNDLDDKDLYDKLQQAGLAERLTSSQEWALVKEAVRRACKNLEVAYLNIPAPTIQQTERYRAMVRVWKYELFSFIEMLRQEGELVFNELHARDAISIDTESEIGISSPDVNGG